MDEKNKKIDLRYRDMNKFDIVMFHEKKKKSKNMDKGEAPTLITPLGTLN